MVLAAHSCHNFILQHMIELSLAEISSQHPPPSKNSRKKPLKEVHFEFPPEQFQYRRWQSIQQVISYFQKNKPREWKYTHKMYTAKSYVNQSKDCRKVIIQCRVCQVKIEVRVYEDTGIIKIVKFENQHKHIVNRQAKVQQQQMIKQFLRSLPPSQRFHDYVKVVMDKYQITKNRANYILQKFVGKPSQTIEEIMQRVRKQIGAQFRVWREPHKNSSSVKRQTMILMVTDKMINNYKQYGDCLCFDITYKLVRKHRFYNEEKEIEQQQWGSGFFVGQDSNLRLTLFGVALIKYQTAENIEQLFNSFFAIMKYKIPQTIVTDQQQSLSKALADIKKKNDYDYLHLLDWFHKLQAMKRLMCKKLIDRENRTQLLRIYSKLMRQNNPIIFKQLVQQMKSYPDECQQQILDFFLKEKDRYCVSYIGPKFFGFAVSSARNQAFNNVIKNYIPMSTHMSRFFTQILRYQSHLNMKTSRVKRFKQEDAHHSLQTHIKPLRNMLQDRLYQSLVQEVSKLKFIQIIDKVEEGKTTSQRQIQVIQGNYLYTVQLNSQCNFWLCECNYIYHTGFPCCHLLKVLHTFQIPIESYIKKRWFRFQQQFIPQKQQDRIDAEQTNYLDIQGKRLKKRIDKLRIKQMQLKENDKANQKNNLIKYYGQQKYLKICDRMMYKMMAKEKTVWDIVQNSIKAS